MKKELSIYLDATRFIAALVVFLAHFGLHRIGGGALWQVNPYGHQAVAFFFVLSGFVIAYTVDQRERNAADYALARATRLYSVALPAVLLTVALDTLGSHVNPAAYSAEWGYAVDFSFQRFFTSLTYTNELWTLSVRQGSNAAYWSMGYEAPFYVIFGLALFTPERWRLAAVAASLLLAGPSIVVALPVWLAGVWAWRISQRDAVSPRAGLWMFLGSLLAWVAYEAIVSRTGRPLIEGNALFKRKEILQDYILTPLFMLNIIGFNAAAQWLGGPLLRHARAIRWAAGATFTLYLCHLPLAQFLVSMAPWPVNDLRSRALVLLGTLGAVFLLAQVTERPKHAWRRLILLVWPWAPAAQRPRPASET